CGLLVTLCAASRLLVFFFIATATTEIYTFSLHDALPILTEGSFPGEQGGGTYRPPPGQAQSGSSGPKAPLGAPSGRLSRSTPGADRKSTRLNSSHVKISYAVFCLKKKITCRIDGRRQRPT